ncbi:TetR/AcrR family transcriptional regulator [Streptoalloteichus hindustanus]|uniref:TetR/AcrR family transcriptional regulator n=1 Tax=Streptoalloteichus hindustanus TaxID=2017 RepID=UPI00190E61DE|nr:TetR/AcrR family transcriptional regulator C-terminal domain-containing protein [Streptoalloteichus hindustanus]
MRDGRQRLNRNVIVATARRIAEADGLDALTLRRVGHELSTGQASLYRHITDRHELLELLADDVARDLPRLPTEGDARQRLLTLWRAAHDYLARHRWAVRIIADGDIEAPSAVGFARTALAALVTAGCPEPQALRGYRALWHLLLGHLLNAHPLGHHLDEHHVEAHVAFTADDPGAEFEWAMTRLVDGILRTPS